MTCKFNGSENLASAEVVCAVKRALAASPRADAVVNLQFKPTAPSTSVPRICLDLGSDCVLSSACFRRRKKRRERSVVSGGRKIERESEASGVKKSYFAEMKNSRDEYPSLAFKLTTRVYSFRGDTDERFVKDVVIYGI